MTLPSKQYMLDEVDLVYEQFRYTELQERVADIETTLEKLPSKGYRITIESTSNFRLVNRLNHVLVDLTSFIRKPASPSSKLTLKEANRQQQSSTHYCTRKRREDRKRSQRLFLPRPVPPRARSTQLRDQSNDVLTSVSRTSQVATSIEEAANNVRKPCRGIDASLMTVTQVEPVRVERSCQVTEKVSNAQANEEGNRKRAEPAASQTHKRQSSSVTASNPTLSHSSKQRLKKILELFDQRTERISQPDLQHCSVEKVLHETKAQQNYLLNITLGENSSRRMMHQSRSPSTYHKSLKTSRFNTHRRVQQQPHSLKIATEEEEMKVAVPASPTNGSTSSAIACSRSVYEDKQQPGNRPSIQNDTDPAKVIVGSSIDRSTFIERNTTVWPVASTGSDLVEENPLPIQAGTERTDQHCQTELLLVNEPNTVSTSPESTKRLLQVLSGFTSRSKEPTAKRELNWDSEVSSNSSD